MANGKPFSKNRVPSPNKIIFNSRGGKGGKGKSGSIFRNFRNTVSNIFTNRPILSRRRRGPVKTG